MEVYFLSSGRGGDFEQLMLLYNEDTAINSASVCFSHGFMPENYYQAAVFYLAME